MAEISAAYQQSQEEDDASEKAEDHAIWVLVRCSHLILESTQLILK